jgi:hypothetical protein
MAFLWPENLPSGTISKERMALRVFGDLLSIQDIQERRVGPKLKLILW